MRTYDDYHKYKDTDRCWCSSNDECDYCVRMAQDLDNDTEEE